MATAAIIEVVPAFTLRRGREVRDGWDVLVGGEWHNRFRTKREADASARKEAKVSARAFASTPNDEASLKPASRPSTSNDRRRDVPWPEGWEPDSKKPAPG